MVFPMRWVCSKDEHLRAELVAAVYQFNHFRLGDSDGAIRRMDRIANRYPGHPAD